MPETPFTVELPDGSERSCYSPSSAVKKYFSAGDSMPAPEFEAKATEALNEASRRVQQQLGFT
ncbi:MAG: hypothetical protein ACSHX0_12165 [Akkermansiaceae bacterium]